MNRLRRALMLVLLAVGVAACGRGCGCASGEKTYEHIDGKYRVTLVRKTHWTGGKIGGPVSNFFIRVETTPPFDEPLYGNCTHADMAEDDAGKHVAFRCQGTAEWTVLRLRGGDRRIRECSAPVGTRDKPSYEKLESVRKSASRILGCERDEESSTVRELLRAVYEDEGSNVASEFALELAAVINPLPRGFDGWDAGVAYFDEPGRKRALDGLCASLTRADGSTTPHLYVRAAMRCSLEGDAVAAGALATFRRLLDQKLPDDSLGASATQTALRWSGLIAGAKHPQTTGAAVCAKAGDGDRERWRQRTTYALLLAHTNTSCPVVDEWLTAPPCNFLLDCDGGLCTAAELAADRAWNEPLDGGVRAPPTEPYPERAILAAAYARGPLPEKLVLPNARRTYTFVDAGSLPSCSDGDLDSGAPCECQLDRLEPCRAPVTRDPLWRNGYCSIRVDDKHRVFEDVRRVCSSENQPCSSEALCCAGLDCRDDVCAPRPKAPAVDAARVD